MATNLLQYADICSEDSLKNSKHALLVLDESTKSGYPFENLLLQRLKRAHGEFKDIEKTPASAELPNGGLASFVLLKANLSEFQRHALLRKALKPLLSEHPETLTICVFGDEKTRQVHACAAYYVAMVNAQQLPSLKKDIKHKPLKKMVIHGFSAEHQYQNVNARVAGNALCRTLTMTPPNQLTPTIYREKIKTLAKEHGWQHEELDMSALRKMGAGAFVAVGQGSDPEDAAIVHLTYAPKNAGKHIALVGKGICFDTGGHNLKPAKYMYNMHEDMNGSAVALGILQAATQMQLPVKLDCWLAIAQNHISPLAYKQNDVVKALNGMTIEVIHTDAEGRMVLADTLTLASRANPDAILDYATLTGAMAVAVTERMSGVVANRPELTAMAVEAGAAAGERIVAFPYEEDMDSDLDSDIADIKQCTPEGGGDHMHAARFMGKFIENDVAWVHADLSSTNFKGGLGAVESTVNGFGVGFGLEMVKRLIA
jgi:leucyl aminopeptidase